MSAGSCFAARVVETLRSSGLDYLARRDILEAASDEIVEESPNLFSARYGNVYTTKHLLQLLERSTTALTTPAPVAVDSRGRFRNLLRPGVLSYGNEDALRRDDEAHLRNVRDLLAEADVFVFTLGLTEQWIDVESGYTLPSVPGCGHGRFESGRYSFHNASLSDVTQELFSVFELLGTLNPQLKVILTLSPVPLVASYEAVSAVEATFYSKAVLRLAISEALSRSKKMNVSYFPSYEIVTNPHVIGTYFAKDMRAVTDAGLESVMSQFKRRYFASPAEGPARREVATEQPMDIDPACEEENVWMAYMGKIAGK